MYDVIVIKNGVQKMDRSMVYGNGAKNMERYLLISIEYFSRVSEHLRYIYTTRPTITPRIVV